GCAAGRSDHPDTRLTNPAPTATTSTSTAATTSQTRGRSQRSGESGDAVIVVQKSNRRAGSHRPAGGTKHVATLMDERHYGRSIGERQALPMDRFPRSVHPYHDASNHRRTFAR